MPNHEIRADCIIELMIATYRERPFWPKELPDLDPIPLQIHQLLSRPLNAKLTHKIRKRIEADNDELRMNDIHAHTIKIVLAADISSA
jgi:hypothetical protein